MVLRIISVSQKVYRLVKTIPKGKVATYGQLVSKCKVASGDWKVSPRVIGWILHKNKDPKFPCHRVVDRNGRIAPNYAFGGADEQRRRLLVEGVKFKDEMHVDLDSCRWQEKF